MPDTGERREIKRFVNAKEADTVRESKKLLSKTKQKSAQAIEETKSRGRRKAPANRAKKPGETEGQKLDREGSERMADEGDPNPRS